ncbi:hypothetical protein N3K66_004711 [Trichothecium roseum]|uniref:Uncharacterized protein n=1 Tax=Trichothecium roseum TaxID=47278 RepID=A0ACC0V226_9HYPO|nr:hypothetical protein N3K66_004711 [Trichothecium roseum]
MDDFAAEIIGAGGYHDRQRTPSPEATRHDAAEARQQKGSSNSGGGGGGGGLRGSFAALRGKANIQDRLVEKLLSQVIPTDDDAGGGSGDGGPDASGGGSSINGNDDPASERPNFNITTMSYNFRRLNARIGVVFKFQAQAGRVLAWRRPSRTVSLLAVYTFVCLDPYLLSVLPIAVLLVGVFIPGFLARHPAPPKGTLSSEQGIGYSPSGPPLAPAATVRPVKELSKDFFRNMRDLQNSMGDFSTAHDQVVSLVVPLTNFADEALSSAAFLFFSVAALFMSITAQLIPWRLVFLLGGWSLIFSGHPAVARLLAATHSRHVRPREEDARSWLSSWVAADVILDSAPETREVEVFELQRVSEAGGEWEPWMFTPSPYDPLSHPRISGERPRGTRFFEDVLAPDGWEWSEKKWALDLWSREWVEERIITGVEVETEGERWVYDIYEEKEDKTGVVIADAPEKTKPRIVVPQPSWEEGEDANGRRGEWRRRRWVRLVKRRVTPAPAA